MDMGAMTHKVGPLPVYAWGLLLGGVGVVWVWRSQSASTASAQVGSGGQTPVLDSGSDASAASGTVYGYSDPSAGLSGSSVYTSTGVSSNGTGINYSGTVNTNDTWLSKAVGMASKFGYSPLALQTALQQYLNGAQLNKDQQSMVNAVIGKMGTSPEGVWGTANNGVDSYVAPKVAAPPKQTTMPVGKTVPISVHKPTAKPAPKKVSTKSPTKTPAKTAKKTVSKPAQVNYKIRYGDTLSGIAVKNHTSVAAIQKLNPTIKNPNRIYAGRTIRVK